MTATVAIAWALGLLLIALSAVRQLAHRRLPARALLLLAYAALAVGGWDFAAHYLR